jgi:hypothetical protein
MKARHWLWLLLALLALEWLYLSLGASSVFYASRYRANKPASATLVMLPYYKVAPRLNLTFEVDLTYHKGDPTTYRIRVNDCLDQLLVNQCHVPLLPNNQLLCDVYEGVVIDLPLREGKNRVELHTMDASAREGLTFAPVWPLLMHMPDYVPPLAMLALIAYGGYCRRKQWNRATWIILAAPWPFYIWHYFTTDWLLYSQDWSGHIDYLLNVAQTGWRPPLELSSISRQSPGYYLIGGSFYALLSHLGAPYPLHGVRALALPAHALFQYFSVLTIMRLMRGQPQRYRYLALALFAFWPIGLSLGGEINNDVFSNACCAAVLYYIVRWHEAQSLRHFCRLILWLSLAFFMKNTAISLAAASLVLFALNWRSLRPLITAAPALRTYVLAAPLFTLGFLYNFIYALLNLNPGAYILSAPVGNRVAPYALSGYWFDLPIFLRYNFYSDYKLTEPQAQTVFNFPNYFLKTMLFGEYSWSSPLFAPVLLPLMLVLGLYGLFHLSQLRKPTPQPDLVPLVVVSCSLLAVIAFRITYATAQTQDFRYCYFILPLLLVWCCKGIHAARRLHPWLAQAGEGAALLFVASSVGFFAAQCWLHPVATL